MGRELLGTLPSLENSTMEVDDPESLPAHAPENSNCQNGGLRYIDALESLHVRGPFFLIQHLLGPNTTIYIGIIPCPVSGGCPYDVRNVSAIKSVITDENNYGSYNPQSISSQDPGGSEDFTFHVPRNDVTGNGLSLLNVISVLYKVSGLILVVASV